MKKIYPVQTIEVTAVSPPGDGLTRMLRTLQQNGLFYVEKLDDVQFEDFSANELSLAETKLLWATLKSMRKRSGNVETAKVPIDDVRRSTVAPTGDLRARAYPLPSVTSDPAKTVAVMSTGAKIGGDESGACSRGRKPPPVQRSRLRRWRESELEFRIFQFFCAVFFGYDYGYSKRYPCVKWAKWIYRTVMCIYFLLHMIPFWFVDHLSFELAPLDEIPANSTMPDPAWQAQHANAKLMYNDILFLLWGICLFILLGPIQMGFMFRWSDETIQFLRPRFVALKQNAHPATFIALFYGYMLCFTVGFGGGFGGAFASNTNYNSYALDLSILRDLKNSHNGSLTQQEIINRCCSFRNAYAYTMYGFIPTGSMETGIILRQVLEPPILMITYMHGFWTSAVWSMVLAMLYSEFSTLIEKMCWEDINSGKALAEYMSLVDKLTALSSQWDVRNSAALVLQMAATTLGILCVIGIHNLVHMDDSHKPLYYIVVGMLTFMPALNLFMDLIAAGVVTDTITKYWLEKLKRMELDHILSRLGGGTRSGRRSLSERANKISNVEVVTQQPAFSASATTTTARELSPRAGPLTRKPSPAPAMQFLTLDNGQKYRLTPVVGDGQPDDTGPPPSQPPQQNRHLHRRFDSLYSSGCHYRYSRRSDTVPVLKNLHLLETRISVFKGGASITVGNFFVISTGSVVSVFARLFGVFIIMYGIFYQGEFGENSSTAVDVY